MTSKAGRKNGLSSSSSRGGTSKAEMQSKAEAEEKARQIIDQAHVDFKKATEKAEKAAAKLYYKKIEGEEKAIRKCHGHLTVFIEGASAGQVPKGKIQEIKNIFENEATSRLKTIDGIVNLMKKLEKSTQSYHDHQEKLKDREQKKADSKSQTILERQIEIKLKLREVKTWLETVEGQLSSASAKLMTKEHIKFSEFKILFECSKTPKDYEEGVKRMGTIDFSKAEVKAESEKLKNSSGFKSADEGVNKSLKEIVKALATDKL